MFWNSWRLLNWSRDFLYVCNTKIHYHKASPNAVHSVNTFTSSSSKTRNFLILNEILLFHSVHNSLSNLRNYEQIYVKYVYGCVGCNNMSHMHFILVMWVKYELILGEAQMQYYNISKNGSIKVHSMIPKEIPLMNFQCWPPSPIQNEIVLKSTQ